MIKKNKNTLVNFPKHKGCKNGAHGIIEYDAT